VNKFKVGDLVEVFYNDNDTDEWVGHQGKITSTSYVNDPKYPYGIEGCSTHFGEHEIKLVNNKAKHPKKLKVGDRVEVISAIANEDSEVVGKIGTIYKINSDRPNYPYWVDNMPTDNWSFAASQLKLIRSKSSQVNKLSKGEKNMSKFYRVKKDSPAWLAGAVLALDEDNETYAAISDLWDSFEEDYPTDYVENAAIVEHNS
jgi:hypothetical protein